MAEADSSPSPAGGKSRVLPEASALYQQGNQRAQAREFTQAAELYRQAIALSPDFAEAHNNLANALRIQGDLPGAVESYGRCLQLAPHIAQVHRNLAATLMALNRTEEACQSLARVVELVPDDDETKEMLRLVRTSMSAGPRVKTAGDEQAEAAERAEVEALFQKASELIAASEIVEHEAEREPLLADAQKALARAMQLDPARAGAWHLMGVVAYRSRALPAAVELISRAIAIDPEVAQFYFDLGNVRLTQKQWPEATACFHQALRIRPRYVEAINNLGNAFRKMNRLAEAEACYRETLEIRPDLPIVRRNLAAILLQQNKREEALVACRQVLEILPDDGRTRYMAAFLSGESRETAPTEFLVALFDEYAERFEDHLTTHLQYRVPQLLRESVERILPDTRTDRNILDLGCGTGLGGRAFRDLARRMVGVDLSSRMVEKARECGAYDEVQVAEIHAALASSSEQFDLILAADVLIYVGELDTFLKSCLKALAPQGIIAFSTERDETDTFTLRPTGRFTHGESYIRRIAQDNGLAVLCCDEIAGRTEENQPVPGQVFALSRA